MDGARAAEDARKRAWTHQILQTKVSSLRKESLLDNCVLV